MLPEANESAELTVTEEQAGERLDKLLAIHVESLSRARIQDCISKGAVQIDGATITNNKTKVKTGQQITLEVPEAVSSEILPEAIPLDILFEDEHMLVINKTAGMTVHPAPGNYTGTLVNALLHHCGDSLSGIGGVLRPGIVHRLDKDTSGLMVVAKHDAAHQALSAQLADRSLSREYLAVAWGGMQPPDGTIDAPIARSPKNRQKMAIIEGGKEARTYYSTIEYFRVKHAKRGILQTMASLVRCKLETGRTHQIRVHLAEQGHGLVGDPLYGGRTAQKLQNFRTVLAEETVQFLENFGRQALHAVYIAYNHPHTEESMVFESPLPDDFEQLVSQLRQGGNKG